MGGQRQWKVGYKNKNIADVGIRRQVEFVGKIRGAIRPN